MCNVSRQIINEIQVKVRIDYVELYIRHSF